MKITIEAEAKELAGLLLALQDRQEERKLDSKIGSSLNGIDPPMNILRIDRRIGGGGPGGYADLVCSLSIQDFGDAIKALQGIESNLSALCTFLENRSMHLGLKTEL